MGVQRYNRPVLARAGIQSMKPMRIGAGVDPTDAAQVGQMPDLVTSVLGEAPAIDALELVTAPDATDEATAVVLANANKAAINAIITALKDISAEA